jgi:hypothetical protein
MCTECNCSLGSRLVLNVNPIVDFTTFWLQAASEDLYLSKAGLVIFSGVSADPDPSRLGQYGYGSGI